MSNIFKISFSREYTVVIMDQIEPYGMDDECFGCDGRRCMGRFEIADEIRAELLSLNWDLRFPQSEFNKIFAKLGSDMKSQMRLPVLKRIHSGRRFSVFPCL